MSVRASSIGCALFDAVTVLTRTAIADVEVNQGLARSLLGSQTRQQARKRPDLLAIKSPDDHYPTRWRGATSPQTEG